MHFGRDGQIKGKNIHSELLNTPYLAWEVPVLQTLKTKEVSLFALSCSGLSPQGPMHGQGQQQGAGRGKPLWPPSYSCA